MLKSFRGGRIVVVVDGDHGLDVAMRLRRMQVAEVMEVSDVEAARRLCQENRADACIVAVGETIPDAKAPGPIDAPGNECGVPSLMIVPVVTAYWRRIARRAGYRAVMPATIGDRMFYRRIGAALQRRRTADPGASRRSAMGMMLFQPVESAADIKPTLH